MSPAFVLLDFQHAGVRRRAQCTRRNVDMQQFREVSRTRTTYSTETHTSDFILTFQAQCDGDTKCEPLQAQELIRWSSSNNWILMSCQLYRVTSGQSNSGHKQIRISKLFSHNYICLSSQSTKPVTSQTQNINIQTSDTNFRRVSPFNIIQFKRAHKARTCWLYNKCNMAASCTYHQPTIISQLLNKSHTKKPNP